MIKPNYRIDYRGRKYEEKNILEYFDEDYLGFSITFNIHGDGAERRMSRFVEKVVKPLKEKYPYAEIHIEVNG